jgi:hypothetical protein
MERLTIDDDSLTVEHRVSPLLRASLLLIGLSLLGVPWVFLVRPELVDAGGWPLAITSLIALGATTFAVLVTYAAVFSLERRAVIAFSADRLELAERGIVGGWRRFEAPMRTIVAVRVELDEWTDGASDHRVVLVFRDGRRRLIHRAPDADQAERCANAVRLWVHPPSI